MRPPLLVLLAAATLLVAACTQSPAPAAPPHPSLPPAPPVSPPADAAAAPLSNPSAAGNPHPKIEEAPPACCNHPYYHQVHRAFSDDGLTFQREGVMLVDRASVPAVLQRDDGTTILYYVNGTVDTFDCSTSSDGKRWSPGGCVIYGFTERKAWDPYVVKLDDGTYRLYFVSPPQLGTGGPPGAAPMPATKIMSALSKDGISWLQEEGVRLTESGKTLIDPAAIRIGDQWRLFTWYPGGGPMAPPEQSTMVTAVSGDGLTFAKEGEFQVGGGIPEVARLPDGRYALYFCGNGIEVVTSTDGVRWGGKTGTGLPGCDPSVIQEGGRWVMYYKEAGFGGGGPVSPSPGTPRSTGAPVPPAE